MEKGLLSQEEENTLRTAMAQLIGSYKKEAAQQSAVEWLIEQLQAPCRGIPSHIIEQAKEMFEQQIKNAWDRGEYIGKSFVDKPIEPEYEQSSEQYYNETFKKL